MGIIPTEKSPKEKDFSKYTCLLHGDPKVGKSTFCSKIPGALFVDTENGLKALEVLRVPVGKWEDYKAFLTELETTKPEHIKTIVIDTVDELWKMAIQRTCEVKNITHVSELGWAQGYDITKMAIALSFAKIKALGYVLFLISHTETRQEKISGVPHTVKGCSLPNSARKLILPLMDFIFYIAVREIVQKDDDGNPLESKWERSLRTKPTREIEAGDRTGFLPAEIPLDYVAVTEVFRLGWEEHNGKKEELK